MWERRRAGRVELVTSKVGRRNAQLEAGEERGCGFHSVRHELGRTRKSGQSCIWRTRPPPGGVAWNGRLRNMAEWFLEMCGRTAVRVPRPAIAMGQAERTSGEDPGGRRIGSTTGGRWLSFSFTPRPERGKRASNVCGIVESGEPRNALSV